MRSHDREPSEHLCAVARPRGRPRAPVQSEPVCVRFHPAVHDALCRKALRDDVPVSDLVRKAVSRDLGITI
jgi:hypothetical protein